MSGFYRDSPPRTKQERSTCWAAATSAWSRVTKGVTDHSVKELIDEAKDAKVVAWNGQLRGDKGIEWLANKFNLRWERDTFMAIRPSMEPRLRNRLERD